MKKTILYTTGFFLLLTATLKAVALWKGGVYLQDVDKLLGIKNLYILWPAMLCELAIVGLILVKPFSRITAISIFFLGTEFGIYRTISAVGGFAVTCPCIGNMGKALGLTIEAEVFILSFIAAWLFISGALLLLWYKPFRLNPDH